MSEMTGGPALPRAIGFQEAITRGFQGYVDFAGRATRSEYWWWFLFAVLVDVVFAVVGRGIGLSFLQFLVSLALFLPGLAVAIRRLHDTDRSGWWILIGFVPIAGFIVLIIFFTQVSNPGANKYGPLTT